MPYNDLPPECRFVIEEGVHKFTGHADGRTQLHNVVTDVPFFFVDDEEDVVNHIPFVFNYVVGDDGTVVPLGDDPFGRLLPEG